MPHHIVLHPGGLGDLVLAAPLIAGLPGTVTLAAREDFIHLRSLLPKAPTEWVSLPVNPYTTNAAPPEWAAREAEFASRLRATAADVFIDASFRPTWLSPPVAAMAGVTAITAAEAVEKFSVPPHQPWRISEELRTAALDWLDAQGLQAGNYIVCFPGGAPQVPVKRWPAARFVELLNAQPLPVLLLGDHSEHTFLAELAPRMPGPGAYFGGRPQELPLAAALLALAAAYCGNDTGPMHLAQAYGTPGVAFFGGGGEWPHYAPWAPGTIGLVHPLPCFGCRWDCCLGHGRCVEQIPVSEAQQALRLAMENPGAPPAVRTLATLSEESLDILSAASTRYREAQADRMARQVVIEGLQKAADERLAILIANHEAAAARGAALDHWERRVAALSPPLVQAVQISTGLGAGNTGDELMAHAFWDALPAAVTLRVPLFPESANHRAAYPDRHRLEAVRYEEGEGHLAHWPGLVCGGTPVAEAEGLGFPLEFLRTRLLPFQERGLPVDAVGVGVEPLRSAESRALFQQAFSAVRSWTVRSAGSHKALLELGVPPERVRVGADWAWLHNGREDKREWARQAWREAGADPARPLVAVNAVNMQWRGKTVGALAEALDTLASRTGAQIGFLANDCRAGEFFDDAAGDDLAAAMRQPLLRLPRLYYSAEEAIALLGCAAITVGQRYHFLIQSVLGGTVPVAIPRGAKTEELAEELELLTAGTVVALDPNHAAAVFAQALAERAVRRERLDTLQQGLRERAGVNLSFLRELAPYDAAFAR